MNRCICSILNVYTGVNLNLCKRFSKKYYIGTRLSAFTFPFFDLSSAGPSHLKLSEFIMLCNNIYLLKGGMQSRYCWPQNLTHWQCILFSDRGGSSVIWCSALSIPTASRQRGRGIRLFGIPWWNFQFLMWDENILVVSTNSNGRKGFSSNVACRNCGLGRD